MLHYPRHRLGYRSWHASLLCGDEHDGLHEVECKWLQTNFDAASIGGLHERYKLQPGAVLFRVDGAATCQMIMEKQEQERVLQSTCSVMR